MTDINYKKLRLDVLQQLVGARMIECHDNKTDMIRQLELDDIGEYVRPTTVEKIETDKFLIGIDIATHDQLVQMGRLIEKSEATRSHYSMGRLYYISNINILENELD